MLDNAAHPPLQFPRDGLNSRTPAESFRADFSSNFGKR